MPLSEGGYVFNSSLSKFLTPNLFMHKHEFMYKIGSNSGLSRPNHSSISVFERRHSWESGTKERILLAYNFFSCLRLSKLSRHYTHSSRMASTSEQSTIHHCQQPHDPGQTGSSVLSVKFASLLAFCPIAPPLVLETINCWA